MSEYPEEDELQPPLLDPYLNALYMIRALSEDPDPDEGYLTALADIYMIANQAIETADEE